MNIEKLYYEIKQYIDILDFSKLWRGFKPLKFALYTNEECFFDGQYIKKSKEFIANTSIFYNGEWIAIWYVQEPIDNVVLASKIVHEMFHGFQMINKDNRFPDELDALYNYNYDEENLNLKVRENQILFNLSLCFNKEMFQEFLQIRKFRSNKFSYEYRYESGIEQIEGSANYVELFCLKQLSQALFEKKLSEMRNRIIELKNLVQMRVISYDIGAIFLYILKENGIFFEDGFSSQSFSETIIADVTAKKYDYSYDVKRLLDSYNSKAKEIIRRAIEKNEVIVDKRCDLLAVNVYNAIFLDNHIISTYFVMFGSQDNPQIEYGDFVLETSEYKIVTKIYRL